MHAQVYKKAAEIQAAISEGATSFLFTEYKYLAYFVAGFSVVIFILLFSERPEHANENVTFFQRFSYTVDSNWLPRELRNAGEVVRRKPTLFNGESRPRSACRASPLLFFVRSRGRETTLRICSRRLPALRAARYP